VDPRRSTSCTAFAGAERIAAGPPHRVAEACKLLAESGDQRPLLVFDDETAEQLELDLRGSVADVRARLSAAARALADASDGHDVEARDSGSGASSQRGPGRPRLGVVGREVTLLPRHWEWLGSQPGGASVTLRKLVEQARKAAAAPDRLRRTREAAYRLMSSIAGNEPGYEEAVRALFAGDPVRFRESIALWPADVRDYVLDRAAGAFEGPVGASGGAEAEAGAARRPLALRVLPDALAIVRLPADSAHPAWATGAALLSITRTRDELSIVCDEACVPADVVVERGWRALAVGGPLDFGLTGVLASIAAPLASAGVSIFAVSTYDTDYVLVKSEALVGAREVLTRAGHSVA